jgi:Calcineurin-like phosphoesterase/FlgD Ig-like domain
MTRPSRSRPPRVLAIAAACAAFIAAGGSSDAAGLTRYPWVNQVTTTSAVIAWQTDVPVPCELIYRTSPGAWSVAASDSTGLNHAVTLTALTPNSLQLYAVVSGMDTLSQGDVAFWTAPSQPDPFRFVAFGDIGRATTPQMEVAARVDSMNADLAILTGDIIYDGGEPANYTPQYFDIYNAPGQRTLARTPFYTSLGNHDKVYDGGLTYEQQFYLPSNSGTERYYSFDYDDAHFVALDVTVENAVPGAAMTSWLASDLAATTKPWKFVYFHVPMYSNLGVHGDDPTIAGALGGIFTAQGVDLVFQGHNHYYTRTYPVSGGAGMVVSDFQEPHYVNPGAPIYIVAGGGGRSLYALGASPAYEAFSKSTYHAVVVDVIGSALSLQSVERDGTVIDWMTLTKAPVTDVAPGERGGPRITLERPSPNPFDRSTSVGFTLDRPRRVRIFVADATGHVVRMLADEPMPAGRRAIRWDGRDTNGRPAAAGVYFLSVAADDVASRARIVLLR